MKTAWKLLTKKLATSQFSIPHKIVVRTVERINLTENPEKLKGLGLQNREVDENSANVINNHLTTVHTKKSGIQRLLL